MIIDLSPSMAVRVRDWTRLHKLDVTLLFNCAYYPRGGCQDCSFDAPNGRCKRSHILIDTQCNPPEISLKTKSRNRRKKEININILLSKLPTEIQEEIRKIIEGG